MSLRIYTMTIDCSDPDRLGEFWAQALGWSVTYRSEDGDEVAVERDGDEAPALLFGKVAEPKSVKNRIHLDLAPSDQAVEVERLEGLGARQVDIGQSRDPDVTWVVMADPEGNEFCVLTPR